jgi:CheY-like chemotaxis protein
MIMAYFFKIIVVDDDDEDFYTIKCALEDLQLGHRIAHLKNGKNLFEYLENNLTLKQALPHLILLDIKMPILNGIEVLKLLKENNLYKDIPVVIYSTSCNQEEKKRCLELGAKAFIIKQGNYHKSLAFMNSIDHFLKNSNLFIDVAFM